MVLRKKTSEDNSLMQHSKRHRQNGMIWSNLIRLLKTILDAHSLRRRSGRPTHQKVGCSILMLCHRCVSLGVNGYFSWLVVGVLYWFVDCDFWNLKFGIIAITILVFLEPDATIFGRERGAGERKHRYACILIDGRHGNNQSITRL